MQLKDRTLQIKTGHEQQNNDACDSMERIIAIRDANLLS